VYCPKEVGCFKHVGYTAVLITVLETLPAHGKNSIIIAACEQLYNVSILFVGPILAQENMPLTKIEPINWYIPFISRLSHCQDMS
jgi:hypothetical protein